jgi:hypothetical protein
MYVNYIERRFRGMDNGLIGVIITAICALVGTAIGTIGGIRASNRLVNYQLKELKEEVKKHNSLIDRMYKVEGRCTVLERFNGIEYKDDKKDE